MLNKIMLFLSDLVGVNSNTNYILKKVRDYVLIILFVLFMSIDWDRTLDQWGL